jgi:hypothetical protein
MKLEPRAHRLRAVLSLKPRSTERLGLSRCWLRYLRPDALQQGVKSGSPVVAGELIGEQPVHGLAHQIRHRLVGQKQLQRLALLIAEMDLDARVLGGGCPLGSWCGTMVLWSRGAVKALLRGASRSTRLRL